MTTHCFDCLQPPLNDFVREDPSSSLAFALKQLQANKVEKHFRKTKAAAELAELNDKQFQTALHRRDFHDVLEIEDKERKSHDSHSCKITYENELKAMNQFVDSHLARIPETTELAITKIPSVTE